MSIVAVFSNQAGSPLPPPPLPPFVQWNVLTRSLLIGGIATAVLMLIAVRANRHQARSVDDNLSPNGSAQGLPAGASWKFSDSWASNITAITTAFSVVVVALSDKVSALFRFGAPAAFAVTSAVMLAIAAIAPAGYTMFQKRIFSRGREGDREGYQLVGSWTGLLVASGATVLSVMGSLTACAIMARHAVAVSYNTKIAINVILGIIAAGVAVYVLKTLRWLLEDARLPAGASTLTGIVSVSCCERDQNGPVRRFSLL